MNDIMPDPDTQAILSAEHMEERPEDRDRVTLVDATLGGPGWAYERARYDGGAELLEYITEFGSAPGVDCYDQDHPTARERGLQVQVYQADAVTISVSRMRVVRGPVRVAVDLGDDVVYMLPAAARLAAARLLAAAEVVEAAQ